MTAWIYLIDQIYPANISDFCIVPNVTLSRWYLNVTFRKIAGLGLVRNDAIVTLHSCWYNTCAAMSNLNKEPYLPIMDQFGIVKFFSFDFFYRQTMNVHVLPVSSLKEAPFGPGPFWTSFSHVSLSAPVSLCPFFFISRKNLRNSKFHMMSSWKNKISRDFLIIL